MSDIARIRLTEKNRITEELRLASKYNDIDTASLARFKGGNGADLFIKKQTEKLTEKVSERNKQIEDMQIRLGRLESGDLDDELLSKIKQNTKDTKAKHNVYLAQKAKKKEEEEEDSKFGKKMYDLDRKSDKEQKSYYFNSALRHFNKAEDTLPDWMKHDLERMGNNEGYIWKSVHFYGHREPNNRGYTQVTEAKKGVKVITRWWKDRLQVIEKRGRGPEVVVHEEPRTDKRS